MLKPCCRNLFKIADLFCHLASSFNRTARLHSAHTAKLAQDWIASAVDSLVKMNGLRTCLASTLWTTMFGELCLNATSHFNPAGEHRWAQESSAVDMETSCQKNSINKAILSFPKRVRACVKAGGGHFEHTLKWTTCEILVFVITVNVSWQWKLQLAVDYSMQNWKYGIEYFTAITLEKTKIIFFKIRIVAGSLPYKPRNLGIKISIKISFCPVGYFSLSHPVQLNSTQLNRRLRTQVSDTSMSASLIT